MKARQSPQTLKDELAARLKGPLTLEEPFVHEDRIRQTRSRHVLIVWDAWRQLHRTDRAAIIVDAYATANVLRGDTVRVALGLTQQEALDMGFLPYYIATMRRKSDPVGLADLRGAMRKVGGVRVIKGSMEQLRFLSQQHAEEAYRQLVREVPGPYWQIVHEVSTT